MGRLWMVGEEWRGAVRGGRGRKEGKSHETQPFTYSKELLQCRKEHPPPVILSYFILVLFAVGRVAERLVLLYGTRWPSGGPRLDARRNTREPAGASDREVAGLQVFSGAAGLRRAHDSESLGARGSAWHWDSGCGGRAWPCSASAGRGQARAGKSGWVNGFATRRKRSVQIDACSGRSVRRRPQGRGGGGWPCTAWLRARPQPEGRSSRTPRGCASHFGGWLSGRRRSARRLCGRGGLALCSCAPRAASRCQRDGVDALCAGLRARVLRIAGGARAQGLGGASRKVAAMRPSWVRDPKVSKLRTHVLQPAARRWGSQTVPCLPARVGTAGSGSCPACFRSVGGAAGRREGALRVHTRGVAVRGLGRLPG